MTDPIMKDYLGDGLFVEFDGFQFRLYTERDSGTHEVFLEPHMVAVFLDFVKAAKVLVRGSL
jgi:hypothetical protein